VTRNCGQAIHLIASGVPVPCASVE
jgi:hypothetical protein